MSTTTPSLARRRVRRSRAQGLAPPHKERQMEPIVEALQLLKRQAEIQNDLRRSRDNPLLAERELFLIRRRLAQYPAAVQTIALTAAELHRPVDTLSVRDVEKRC